MPPFSLLLRLVLELPGDSTFSTSSDFGDPPNTAISKFFVFSTSREPCPPYSGLGVLVIECGPLCLVVSCREVWGAWWYEKGAGWRAGCLTCKWEANLRRKEEGGMVP